MDIHASLHAILQRKDDLANQFYGVLWERNPDLRPLFQGVSMHRQALLLTMALIVIERHYEFFYPATESYLNYLGTQHHDRGIPPESYARWRDALLATLEGFHGSDWNPNLRLDWHKAIDFAIESMLKGYRTHFSV